MKLRNSENLIKSHVSAIVTQEILQHKDNRFIHNLNLWIKMVVDISLLYSSRMFFWNINCIHIKWYYSNASHLFHLYLSKCKIVTFTVSGLSPLSYSILLDWNNIYFWICPSDLLFFSWGHLISYTFEDSILLFSYIVDNFHGESRHQIRCNNKDSGYVIYNSFCLMASDTICICFKFPKKLSTIEVILVLMRGGISIAFIFQCICLKIEFLLLDVLKVLEKKIYLRICSVVSQPRGKANICNNKLNL